MDPKKVSTVLEWQTPQSVKDVQAFLGFANFHRRFIRQCHFLTTYQRYCHRNLLPFVVVVASLLQIIGVVDNSKVGGRGRLAVLGLLLQFLAAGVDNVAELVAEGALGSVRLADVSSGGDGVTSVATMIALDPVSSSVVVLLVVIMVLLGLLGDLGKSFLVFFVGSLVMSQRSLLSSA